MRAALAATLAGCVDGKRTEAVIAQTQAFCAANPPAALPAPVMAERVYVSAGAPTRAWTWWNAERLLRGGFTEIEGDASIAPYIAGTGAFLRFRVAPASDPGCAGQAAVARELGSHHWEQTRRRWADIGLGPDECIAIERTATRRSTVWLEASDASAELGDAAAGLPLQRQRMRFAARDAATGRVLYRFASEHGIVNAGMPTPFGCMRREERDRFTDALVVAPRGREAVARGPEVVDAPALPATIRAKPVAERVRDLGRVPIDGMELEARRTSVTASIPGIAVLVGAEPNPNAIHPDWPRYLQVRHDGRYRRVRLPWLEGSPHGVHEQPLRLFDLRRHIGLLSVTHHMSPERAGQVDFSWTEFTRADGLPRLRADASVPVALKPGSGAQVLVEGVERTTPGLRFRLVEVDVERAARGSGGFVLTRETTWFWPIPRAESGRVPSSPSPSPGPAPESALVAMPQDSTPPRP